MHSYADRSQENKNRSVANKVSPKQSNTVAPFQFMDLRPRTDRQKKLQHTVNTSARAIQLRVFREMLDNGPLSKQATQLQTIANMYSSNQLQAVQKNASSKPDQRENKTGLPNHLKSGIENLSGYSMDDVRVHYNSDKPAPLQAHAYAQGTDIHLAPGQEKHLPHEAWHVVQQKQGRVKPTRQMKGKVNINDDPQLEKEADVMGARAVNLSNGRTTQLVSLRIFNTTIQRNDSVDDTDLRVQQGPSCWLTVVESMLASEGKDTSTLKLLLNMYESSAEVDSWIAQNSDKTKDMMGYTAPMTKNMENVKDIILKLKSVRDKGGTKVNSQMTITKERLKILLGRVSAAVVHSADEFNYVDGSASIDQIIDVYKKVGKQLKETLKAMGNQNWKKQVHSFFKLPDTPIDKKTTWSDFVLTMKHQVKLPAWIGINQGIKGDDLPKSDTDFRGKAPVFKSNNHAIMMIAYGTDGHGEFVKYKNPNRGNFVYTVTFDQFKKMAGDTNLNAFSFKLGLGGANTLVDD